MNVGDRAISCILLADFYDFVTPYNSGVSSNKVPSLAVNS